MESKASFFDQVIWVSPVIWGLFHKRLSRVSPGTPKDMAFPHSYKQNPYHSHASRDSGMGVGLGSSMEMSEWESHYWRSLEFFWNTSSHRENGKVPLGWGTPLIINSIHTPHIVGIHLVYPLLEGSNMGGLNSSLQYRIKLQAYSDS